MVVFDPHITDGVLLPRDPSDGRVTWETRDAVAFV